MFIDKKVGDYFCARKSYPRLNIVGRSIILNIRSTLPRLETWTNGTQVVVLESVICRWNNSDGRVLDDENVRRLLTQFMGISSFYPMLLQLCFHRLLSFVANGDSVHGEQICRQSSTFWKLNTPSIHYDPEE